MGIRAGILGLGMALLAPGAWACPAGSLQGVVDLFMAARQPGASLAKIGAVVDAKAGACLADPLVLRAAVTASSELAEKSAAADQKLVYREAAFRWYARMLVAHKRTDLPAQTVTTPEGPMQFGMSGSYELGMPLINAQFEAEIAAKKLSALTQARAPGAAPEACADYPLGVMLETQQFIRMRGDHAGAFNFIDHGVSGCGRSDGQPADSARAVADHFCDTQADASG